MGAPLGHTDSVNSVAFVAFSPDGKRLASASGYISASGDNSVGLWPTFVSRETPSSRR